MEFKDFIKQNENLNTVRGVKNYIITHENGQFKLRLLPPNTWTAKIVNGQLMLPTELEPHRDDILAAYFNRYPGMNNTASAGSVNVKDSSSDIFGSPQNNKTFVFNPQQR